MALLRPFSSTLPSLQPPKPSKCSISNPHISKTFRISFPSPTHHPICCSNSVSQSDSSNSPPSTGVFIKGLPLSTAEGRLKKVFSQFGEVKHVNVVREKVSKQSLGSAFVWFDKEESAQLAVNEMNGKKSGEDNTIRVLISPKRFSRYNSKMEFIYRKIRYTIDR